MQQLISSGRRKGRETELAGNGERPEAAGPEATDSPNPYIGPRTFTRADRDRYFGRKREARNLLARCLSERLLLFYAPSGAGKSSLLHTRLIPMLEEEEGIVVLPVARVAGDLPAGVASVSNVHLFNLMTALDQALSMPAGGN